MINILKQLGIVSLGDNKTASIFDILFPDIYTSKYKYPSELLSNNWLKYKKSKYCNNNLNGKIFEYILATIFIREKLLPLYLSAKVAFVPNIIYDIMFYSSERGPICISAKTSLRERYKQADLEAIALKYVHRKALCYLITLEKREGMSVREKIKTGDVIGLDNVVLADTEEFDKLINEIREYNLFEPKPVTVINSNHIITIEKVNSILK